MGEVILTMKDIDKSFPGVHALDHVNFEVKRGEVHALMGENGAGKSTLMKVLTGIYQKDSGSIVYKGQETEFHNTREAQDAGVVIVHQELNMVGDLTVAQNIFIGREPKKGFRIDDKKMIEDSKKLFQDLNIEINPKEKMKNLTVGKQQMCEIAKAISHKAEVIIFDEPSAALTEKEIADLFEIIRDLRKKNLGIVYISHRMDEIKTITDRVTVMRDGGQLLDVGAGLAHSLEWDPARAVALGVACPHENIVRSLRERAARGSCVQIAANYLLLPLEHLRLQRVALATGRGLRCHAEVHGSQEPSLVGDGELLDGLAGDLDAAGHLLRLAAARWRDLRLLDVVDGRDLLSDPARSSGLDVLDGVADGLLAAVLDCLEVSDELVQVAELRRDAVLRHGRRLLPIRKKRPAGVGSPVGLLPSVVIRFSSGQPLGIVTALPVCPAVFCRI